MKNTLVILSILLLAPTAFGFMGIGNLQAQKTNTAPVATENSCDGQELNDLQKAQLELVQLQIELAKKQLKENGSQSPKPSTVRVKCANDTCTEQVEFN